jgi:hypothetical protein
MLPSAARGGSGGIATAFVCVHARWGSAGHLVLSTGKSRLSRLSLLTETRRNQSVSEYMTRWLEDFAKGISLHTPITMHILVAPMGLRIPRSRVTKEGRHV